MPRNNQQIEQGNVLTAALTGTGSAANLFAAQPGLYIDIVTLVLTNTTPATNAICTLSDGTTSYVFNVGQPVVMSCYLSALKSTSLNTAWTLNATSAVNAVAIAVASLV